MRVGFCADTHIANHRRWGGSVNAGINQRCALALAALQRAAERAVALQCRAFVVCGDVFDHARPEPQIIAWVQETCEYLLKHECTTILLVGNHDQVSGAPGDHALAPLAPVARVIDAPRSVLLDEGLGISLVCVPFMPLAASAHFAEWADAALAVEDMCTDRRILAAHVGISDESTPFFLHGARDAINVDQLARICADRGIEAAVVGNWHTRRRWTRDRVELFQLGTLIPAGFDDPGLARFGTLGIWDSERGFSHEVISGPRFIIASTLVELSGALMASSPDDALFISYRGPEEDHANAGALLLSSKTRVLGSEFVLDEAALHAGKVEAAEEARAANASLYGALSAYVDAMPVPGGVERQEVLVEASRALRASRA